MKEKILIVGACGQLGVELTLALRQLYGKDNVIAADRSTEHPVLTVTRPFIPLDVLNRDILQHTIKRTGATQVYLLAAMLSATGEKDPAAAWQLNMGSLLNVLEIAKEEKLKKLFWPSSIAVFGASAPKENCSQATIT